MGGAFVMEDTIAAISTPVGEAGLAVVRLSGAQALTVADRCFVPLGRGRIKVCDAASHTVHYGKMVSSGKRLDEVMLTVYHPPRTFTREPMVEISCHGGILPAKLVLDALLAAGARMAEPGEFTKRAFLNGRIDLAQAEAVADIIHSRTELALEAANEQLEGRLSRRINLLRDDLMSVLAHLEAHLDFPDEDIQPDAQEKIRGRLEDALVFMTELLRTANEGRILRRGIRAVIVGRPNAGKSSLLNELLGQNRAIVSPLAGTTRDTIEETANIRGLPVVFIDTAGLRIAGDAIEQEGVRRTREALARVELVLHVLDASALWTPEDTAHLEEFSGKKRILIRNKIDLTPRMEMPSGIGSPVIDVSCVNGQGIEPLKDSIKELVWAGEIRAGMLQVMINSRHQEALNRAREVTRRTIEAMDGGAPLDLVAIDLRIATGAVGEIVGKTATEDLLDSIFSQFCIGK